MTFVNLYFYKYSMFDYLKNVLLFKGWISEEKQPDVPDTIVDKEKSSLSNTINSSEISANSL